MALVNLNGVVEFPKWPSGAKDMSTTPGNSTLNGATDTYAVTVLIAEAGTIDKVHFRVGSSTGTNTIRVSFQNLDSNLRPDGTDTHWRDYTQTGTEDNSIIETGLITTDGTDIGTKKTVAVGDHFAIVITMQSFTSGSFAINHFNDASDNYITNSAWFDESGSTFTISNRLSVNPSVMLEYSDASFPYMDNVIPYETGTNHTLDDADSPDEYALKITVPFSCRARGIFIKGATQAGVTAVLYDAADSVQGGGAIALEVEGTGQNRVRYFHFATAVEITKDVVYRIAWKPPASPTTSIIHTWSIPDANMRKVLPNGLNMERSTRVDSGTWTDSTTNLLVAGYLIDQLDDGAAGGGGSCSYGAISNGTRVLPAYT
jgi:hypothetical protein